MILKIIFLMLLIVAVTYDRRPRILPPPWLESITHPSPACQDYLNDEEDGKPIDIITYNQIDNFEDPIIAVQPNRVNENYNDKMCYSRDSINRLAMQLPFRSPYTREPWYTDLVDSIY